MSVRREALPAPFLGGLPEANEFVDRVFKAYICVDFAWRTRRSSFPADVSGKSTFVRLVAGCGRVALGLHPSRTKPFPTNRCEVC